MVIVNINNVPIDFPYEPYKCQFVYMEKVVQCLENGTNGILESPTGTGKTLCLLCACLGWLESEREKFRLKVAENEKLFGGSKQSLSWSLNFLLPKIIYTSRTHSQLSQVVRELNKTIYRTKIKVCLFGSRDHLCINNDVRKEENSSVRNALCRVKIQNRGCPFYWGYEKSKNTRELDLGQIKDIEDFVELGRKHSICPFFKVRENYVDADLILMPYNYVLEPRTRAANKIDLKNNIVIFDEAHNLEKICEESASVSFGSKELAGCLKETKETLTSLIAEQEELRTSMDETAVEFGKTKDSNSLSLINTNELTHLLLLLDNLEKQIDSIDYNKLYEERSNKMTSLNGVVLPGHFVFELLQKSGIAPQMRDSILSLIDQSTTYLTQKASSDNGIWRSKGLYLEKFASFIGTVFDKDDANFSKNDSTCFENHSKMFKVFVQKEELKPESGQQKITKLVKPGGGIVLNYWCFSAGLSMTTLTEKGVRCVIVTSGTLSPIQHFASEMKIPFPVVLENEHVIDKQQVLFNVIRKGPDSQQLLATFANRNNEKYLASLANTLINLFRLVPEGVLVFFASYPHLHSCLEYWKTSEVFNKMNQLKPVFVEPKNKDQFRQCLSDFTKAVNDPKQKGAAFFGVCRGKVSEGVDFADNAGRAVILAGLPYPPLMDPRVVLKKAYLSEQNNKQFSAAIWYETEAVRAVNQALGRVIRHKDDYGAILMADERFSNWGNCFPKWTRSFLSIEVDFGLTLKSVANFFKGRKSSSVCTSNFICTEPASAFVQTEKYSQEDLTRKRHMYNSMNPKKSKSEFCEEGNFDEISTAYYSDAAACSVVSNDDRKKISSSSSALDLLDAQTECHETPVFSPLTQPFNGFTSLKYREENGKRKIRIVARSKEKVSSSKEVFQNAAHYASAVKKVLPTNEYDRFKDVCKNYKRTNDYSTLLKDLNSLFLPSYFDLLLGFETFLNKSHKIQFAKDVSN